MTQKMVRQFGATSLILVVEGRGGQLAQWKKKFIIWKIVNSTRWSYMNDPRFKAFFSITSEFQLTLFLNLNFPHFHSQTLSQMFCNFQCQRSWMFNHKKKTQTELTLYESWITSRDLRHTHNTTSFTVRRSCTSMNSNCVS